MIKVNELRIGNLVSDINASDKFSAKVNKITSNRVYYGLFHSHPNDLKPIKITEDRISKSGFILSADYGDQKHYEHPSLRKFSVVFDHEEIALHHVYGDSYVCVFYDDMLFQFMHQLQNFFFSIVGEELVFSNNA